MRIGMMVDGYEPHERGIINAIPLNKRPREQPGLPMSGVQSVGVSEPEKDQITVFLRSRSLRRRSKLRLLSLFRKQQP